MSAYDRTMLEHYSRALDEIYRLRTIVAAEALRIDADLELKSFPKSRRQFAEHASIRLKAAAQGRTSVAYDAVARPKACLHAVDAGGMLTRAQWEAAS